MERNVFYVSDGTAITAEVLGHAVLSQFPVNTVSYTLPFVESEARAKAVCEQINTLYHQSGVRPLVLLYRHPDGAQHHHRQRRVLPGYRAGAGGSLYRKNSIFRPPPSPTAPMD